MTTNYPRLPGMPAVSEYAGLPTEFAVGTITAARLWTIDTYGRLVGQYGQVWRPGENVAACPNNCSGIENDCTCGFWAFHDPQAIPGSWRGVIPGVIEAYGTVVVGTKGIRCSKARIIGLCAWDNNKARLLRNYPDLNIVSSPRKLRKLLRGDSLPGPESLGDDFWTHDTKPLAAPSPTYTFTTGAMSAFSPRYVSSGGWTVSGMWGPPDGDDHEVASNNPHDDKADE